MTSMRRFLNGAIQLAALVGLACSAGLASSAPAPPVEGPRNILLLISDDQGLDAGCYGNPYVKTPNIDRLAAQGTLFTRAFAAVSSCSPSRATILTGMYNHANGQYGLAHGAHNQRTRPDVQSLPKLLNEKGYRTGILGKYHLGPDEVYPFQVRGGEGANRKPVVLGQKVREFLQSGNKSPFFLTVGFGDPHRAMEARFPVPAGAPKREAGEFSGETTPPAFLMDLPEVRGDYADYCASVNNLDRCVGSVLSALEESGASTNTLVIFLSDNGIPFPGAKTNLYEPGIRLPLIIREPGAASTGSKSDALASWVDIAPTILEWAGLGKTRMMSGQSLLALVRQPASKGPERVFASNTFHEITMYYPMRCVRTADYKLIWNLAHELPYPLSGDIRRSPSWMAISRRADARIGGHTLQEYLHRPEFELYDMRSDEAESHNLADSPEHKEILARLKGDLLKMMKETRDPWLPEGEQSETGE